MATRIVIDDVAKAVRSVWPAAGGLTMELVYLNRRPAQTPAPYGVIRVVEGQPSRESDGIALQRFDVECRAWLKDGTTTRAVGQAMGSIPELLIASALLHWPAGLVLPPDVVPGSDGTLDTDPRLQSAADVYELRTRFAVIINPIP